VLTAQVPFFLDRQPEPQEAGIRLLPGPPVINLTPGSRYSCNRSEEAALLSKHNNQILSQTGPGTPMGELFRRFWNPVLLSEELPHPDCDPVAVRILGEDLIAFRDSEGKVGLIDAYCAHRHAHLFWGRNEESGLRCTYHGWKYDVDGACVDMPNESAESSFKAKVHLTAYPTREMGAMVWAYMGPPELMPPDLPNFEGSGLQDSQWHVTKEIQLSNWAQAVEGGIDSSHISYLHRTLESLRLPDQGVPHIRGNIENNQHPVLAAADRSPVFLVEPSEFGLWIAARRNADDDGYYWRQSAFLVPAWSIIPGAGPSRGGHFWLPIDDEHCWVFSYGWSVGSPRGSRGEEDTVDKELAMWGIGTSNSYLPVRNRDNNYLISRDAQRNFSFTGIESIRAQDRSIQESMGAIIPREKEHLGTTDTGIIEFRRLMLDLARDLLEGKEPPQPSRPDVYRVVSCAVVLDRSLAWPEATREFVKARV
jgi:phthalate 4,5-dioxygenase